MENWKRALLAGAAGASVIFFLKRKPTAGLVMAGVGLATLASEYPEKFAKIRQHLPEYIERGTTFLEVTSRAGERMAGMAGRRASTWFEALLNE